VCPTKAISWKGSKILLKGSEVQSSQVVNDTPFAESVENPTAVKQQKPTKTRKISVKQRNRRLEIAAWIAALAVLAGAIVYYNVILPPPVDKAEIAVGNPCPNFEMQIYGDKDGEKTEPQETVTLYESLGKLTVLNFWATWCTPCVAELPYFEMLQKNYADDVKVFPIHGTAVGESVPDFINNKDDWKDYTLTFAQDVFFETEVNGKMTSTDIYTLLGGEGTWPMTMILDSEGKILFIKQGSLTYEDLVTAITPHLN
jgi:thiol-disulfide isomerase/thioredoxin